MRLQIANRKSQILPALLALLLFPLTGCNFINSISFAKEGEGALNIRANTESGNRLSGSFSKGSYAFDDRNNLTVLLIDGPADNPTQVVTIRMMWEPRVGKTPIDPNATNATIHYMIFTAGGKEVGVYSGAGYVYPNNDPGGDVLNAAVWQANLELADRSVGFVDQLGPAIVSGGFTARLDPIATQQSIRRMNQLVTDRL